jgi:DNA helicase-2/ATP-dependent DNA helicase PcrA
MPRTPLNAAQRVAVCTLSGPLRVLAGAGSGKTRVITFRNAELIKHGVKPQRILAVTFTNQAARDMKERAMNLLTRRGRAHRKTKTPEFSTFHSLCVRILRRHAHHLGYPAAFTIDDRGSQESVARAPLRDIRVGHEKLRPQDLIGQIGAWKSRSVRAEDAGALAAGDQQQLAAPRWSRSPEPCWKQWTIGPSWLVSTRPVWSSRRGGHRWKKSSTQSVSTSHGPGTPR